MKISCFESDGTYIEVDFDNKVVSYNKMTLNEVYSELKDIWINDSEAIKYQFPVQGTKADSWMAIEKHGQWVKLTYDNIEEQK